MKKRMGRPPSVSAVGYVSFMVAREDLSKLKAVEEKHRLKLSAAVRYCIRNCPIG